jgi:hypothetical protein
MNESMEGWYSDPYQRHEARWMSQGTPTQLVRDGDIEGSDPVGGEPFAVTPTRIEGEGLHDGSDMKRADDAELEGPFDPQASVRAAWDVFDQSTVQQGWITRFLPFRRRRDEQ